MTLQQKCKLAFEAKEDLHLSFDEIREFSYELGGVFTDHEDQDLMPGQIGVYMGVRIFSPMGKLK